jgi:hypothetical protein
MINSKYRVATGYAMIVAGVVVAVIGWFGVSGQTEVAFQLPYFASAAVGALMLLGFGGLLLLNAQLETDGDRLEELEEAVRQLSNEIGRLVDDLTPRRGSKPMRAVLAEKEKEASEAEGGNGGSRTRRTKVLTP